EDLPADDAPFQIDPRTVPLFAVVHDASSSGMASFDFASLRSGRTVNGLATLTLIVLGFAGISLRSGRTVNGSQP
ncbi:MAG: hypothetical protein OXE53_05845, partial [Deltaproteobacteria bacterium]|nr:hypothetical protein [Deltaproteobacteria bacterium]